jgi:hypothetical protein
MRVIFFLYLIFFLNINSFAEVDLSAPSATPPEQESTPNSDVITDPLTNLVANYKAFVLPSHYSVCYAPTVQFLNKRHVLNGHCIALERHRATIGLIAVLMWAILGFSIIMSA